MYNTLQRLNAVSALATSVVLCLLGAISLSTFFISHNPSAALDVHGVNVISGRAQYHMDRRVQDYLLASFDVEADVSSLFNWNTKQVFLSIVAEYNSISHPQNQVVIWDRIVRRKEDARIALQDAENKYGFREVSRTFENITSASFVLKWNVMPYVGLLTYGDEGRTGELRIPARATLSDGTVAKPERMWY